MRKGFLYKYYITRRRTIVQAKTVGLWLQNAILFKRLRVNHVLLSDVVAIKGNPIELYWKVKGCHQIIINGKYKLHGKTEGIKITPYTNQRIEIEFRGLAKTYTTQVKVQLTDIQMQPLELEINPICPFGPELSLPQDISFRFDLAETKVPQLALNFNITISTLSFFQPHNNLNHET